MLNPATRSSAVLSLKVLIRSTGITSRLNRPKAAIEMLCGINIDFGVTSVKVLLLFSRERKLLWPPVDWRFYSEF